MTSPDLVVLCATDLSDSAAHAANIAALCAKALGMPLHLIHVADLGPHDDTLAVPASMKAASDALRGRLRRRAEEAAARLEVERARVAELAPGVEVDLVEGRPWEAIVEAASRLGAALVVVAPHGQRGPREVVHEGLRERLLGSTADRVVRHAPCPVLVTSPVLEPPKTLEGVRWLAAVDFSEVSQIAVDITRAWAARTHGSPVLVHVLPPRETEPIDVAEARALDELHTHEELDAKARLRLLIREPAAAAATPLRVRRGDAAEEIAQAARDDAAAFAVLGTHGRRGLAHFFLGSVVERVLRRSEAHVLCVHAADRARA